MLIDPCYEVKADYEAIPRHLAAIHRKWNVGMLILWYPILRVGRARPDAGRAGGSLPGRRCAHEVRFPPARDGHRMEGSGLFVVNPPYRAGRRRLRALTAPFRHAFRSPRRWKRRRQYIRPHDRYLLRRLLAPAPDRLPEPEAQLALAALLVRIARTDGLYAADEVARIDRVLAPPMRLSARSRRRRSCVARPRRWRREAPDTVRFTRALKDAVALEDRVDLMEALWSVALADGARDDDEEDRLMRLVANLLGLTDVESALARQRVGGAGMIASLGDV